MRRVAPPLIALALLAAAAPPPLSAYAGKQPFEPVKGVTFFRHPAVVKAVGAAAGNPALAKEMLAPTGPSSPVEATATGLKADGCQVHNCGDHHWTMEVARDGSAARLCFHDAATMGERSRWYGGGGAPAMRPGTCFAPG